MGWFGAGRVLFFFGPPSPCPSSPVPPLCPRCCAFPARFFFIFSYCLSNWPTAFNVLHLSLSHPSQSSRCCFPSLPAPREDWIAISQLKSFLHQGIPSSHQRATRFSYSSRRPHSLFWQFPPRSQFAVANLAYVVFTDLPCLHKKTQRAFPSFCLLAVEGINKCGETRFQVVQGGFQDEHFALPQKSEQRVVLPSAWRQASVDDKQAPTAQIQVEEKIKGSRR